MLFVSFANLYRQANRREFVPKGCLWHNSYQVFSIIGPSCKLEPVELDACPEDSCGETAFEALE
jgi:hypothetical protein